MFAAKQKTILIVALAIAAGGLTALLVLGTVAPELRNWLLAATATLLGAIVATLAALWPRLQRTEQSLAELRESLDSEREALASKTVEYDYLDRLILGMGEAVLITDPDGSIVRSNAAADDLLGYDAASLKGVKVDSIIQDDNRRAGSRATTRPREGQFNRRDGSSVCVSYTASEVRAEDGHLESMVYSAQNIDYRKRTEQRIRYLARTDALTKIANRMQFQHLLQQGIARAKRRGQYLALLYLDVDRFKDINDTFGHAAGDTSLEIFARRLTEVLPEGALAGRLAGDEFAVLISGHEHIGRLVRDLTEMTNKLLMTVGGAIFVQGEEIFMTSSVGIALYPRDGDNVVDLLRNADAALYDAKQAGGNCFEFYPAVPASRLPFANDPTRSAMIERKSTAPRIVHPSSASAVPRFLSRL
jgi:diguanylate cyclase (GGDEF)-like protein/PAS domain S-box-containing protein